MTKGGCRIVNMSVLYYSACRISDRFADAARAELLAAIGGRFPIVSVTHKPLKFGDENICVGDAAPVSAWQVYMNALLAAKAATTEWICCAEDDSLYRPCHFDFRPEPDVFAYARNRWVISRRRADDGKRHEAFFYFRERTQFAQLICRRELLIETLIERFAKFPHPVPDPVLIPMGFGEPGRYEKHLGLTPRTRAYFVSDEANITFNHSESIRGIRRVNPGDIIKYDLPPWGKADELWERIHG